MTKALHTLTPESQDLRYIPLKQLVLSTSNVRKTHTRKEDDKQLKASIKAHGINQSLVVIPEGKHFAVIAGGRRLQQLQALVNEGEITEEYGVPCLVKELHQRNVVAISLAENIKASMHPADEFLAFQAMITEGKTIADIAREFSVTQKRVKERLKMAAVAPELLDAYRADTIGLNDIMAFTVCDDHERQLACYQELQPYSLYPYRIKDYLLDTALTVNNRLVKYVTLKAYKKAGGCVITDLFESESYIDNKTLLHSLVMEKLTCLAKPLEKQWRWVDIRLTATSLQGEVSLSPDTSAVPDTIITAINETETALEALDTMDIDDWTDDHDKEQERLEQTLHTLETKAKKHHCYTPEQTQQSGVVISINAAGEVVYEYGVMKAEDITTAMSEDDAQNDNRLDHPKESKALMIDLQHYRIQALQCHLLKDDSLANDLMGFSVACTVFSTYQPIAIAVGLAVKNMKVTKDIQDTQAAEQLNVAKAALNLNWLTEKDPCQRFNAYRALSTQDKKNIQTYCTVLSFGENREFIASVAEATQFSMEDYWQPTKDNYYSRITSKHLLHIGQATLGNQWAAQHHKLNKTALVDALSQQEKMGAWLPEIE